jgi:hypothetical protein
MGSGRWFRGPELRLLVEELSERTGGFYYGLWVGTRLISAFFDYIHHNSIVTKGTI